MPSFNYNLKNNYNSSFKINIKDNSTLIKSDNNTINPNKKQNLNNAAKVENIYNKQKITNFNFKDLNGKSKNFYVPHGGWPPRTRTGPDGRKLIRNDLFNNNERKLQYYQNYLRTNSSKKESDNEDSDLFDEDNSLNESTKESDENDKDNIENESDDLPKFFNDLGNKIKPENGKKVKNLWNNLGQVIQQKPWQKSLATTTPFQQTNKNFLIKNDLNYNFNKQKLSTTKKSIQLQNSAKNTKLPTILSSNDKFDKKILIPYYYTKNNRNNILSSTIPKINLLHTKSTTLSPITTTQIKTSIFSMKKVDKNEKFHLVSPATHKFKNFTTTNLPESIVHFTFVG